MSDAAPELIDTTCPYCGVGCGVQAGISGKGEQRRVSHVSGMLSHPANQGRLCVKGSALHETLGEEGRLLHPRIGGCRSDWGSALDAVAGGFRDIIRSHGPDSVAFYLSGQLLTEDYYVANKLMKGFIGSGNVDTNSRLCMSSAVTAYQRAFGADAVPLCYDDLEACRLLVLTGSNAAWTHPVLYQRIQSAKNDNPDMKVVVIDPRRTASCDIADLHLPIEPGSDAYLFNALLRYLAERDCLDHDYIREHTDGFEAALEAACDPDTAARVSGLEVEDLEQFFRWFARTPQAITFYSQGINQSASGTDKCNAIINCHLATGRVGKPGAGPFSITGQPNAMGGREVGGLSTQLAAHMGFSENNADRLERFWQSPRVARKPGLKAVELFQAIERGEIKAVWIMATNPVVSLPESARVRRALQNCKLVVVSDCIAETDTTACADVLLPAAGWSEKDGTVTNSERRISRQRALTAPAGEARPDWWIVSQVARRLGFARSFDYRCPADIFREHARLSGFENDEGGARRAFDISALARLSNAQYDSLQPLQWPVNEDHPSGTRRLFAEGGFYTDNRRARFLPITPELPRGGCPDADRNRPFVLNTGRLRDQWHTMTRTARSPRLMQHTDRPFVAVSARDALSLGLSSEDLLRLRNSQGDLILPVQIDTGLRDGELFVPIHWNDQYASHGRISTLIPPVTDPHSGQPQSKFARVDIERITAACRLHIISGEALDCGFFDYWTCVPVEGGWRYQAAILETGSARSPEETTGHDVRQRLQPWLDTLGLDLQIIEFVNERRGDCRMLLCTEDRIRAAIYVSIDPRYLPDAAHMQSLLTHTPGSGSWLQLSDNCLSAGTGQRMICSCHQISEARIVQAIEDGARDHEELGRLLRCGTNCGSCVPELKQLLAARA